MRTNYDNCPVELDPNILMLLSTTCFFKLEAGSDTVIVANQRYGLNSCDQWVIVGI